VGIMKKEDKTSDRSGFDSLHLVETLTFKDWWHLLTRYTSVVESKDTLRTVLRIMAHRGFRHLPVVREGALVGIISAGDLIETFAGGSKHPGNEGDVPFPDLTSSDMKANANRLISSLNYSVAILANKDPEIINPNHTIVDAIRIISQKNIGSLLIVEEESANSSSNQEAGEFMMPSDHSNVKRHSGRKLVGIVTLRDIVSILAAYCPFGMKVEECMTDRVATTSDRDSIFSAMSLMSREKVRRLPVVMPLKMTGDGIFVQGMVTNKMILRYLESIISYEMLDMSRAIAQPVKTVMQSPMATIDPKEDCGNAAYLMRELGTGGFAVVDSRGLVGIITERDLIRRIYAKEGLSFFTELFEKGNARMLV
jgi:CBS domain-containing protein